MPRKRAGYDAACYYDGKLLGRCTKADSDAYGINIIIACNMPSIIALFIISPIFTKSQSPLFL